MSLSNPTGKDSLRVHAARLREMIEDLACFGLDADGAAALLAELRELRRLTSPEPIGDKHRDGNWWLVWEPLFEYWFKARWRDEAWDLGWQNVLGTPTHALLYQERPEPPAPRGEE